MSPSLWSTSKPGHPLNRLMEPDERRRLRKLANLGPGHYAARDSMLDRLHRDGVSLRDLGDVIDRSPGTVRAAILACRARLLAAEQAELTEAQLRRPHRHQLALFPEMEASR